MSYDQQLFSIPFHDYTEQQRERITSSIEQAPESEIVDADEAAYIKKLLVPYRFEPLTIKWDETIELVGRKEKKEVVIDHLWGEQREVTRQIYTFEVSYTGSESLLRLQPSTRRLWTFEPDVGPENLQFEIVDKGSEQSNKAALDRIKENLMHDVEHLNSEIASYHSSIEAHAQNAFQTRKSRIEKAVQSMGGFGVPVRGLNPQP